MQYSQIPEEGQKSTSIWRKALVSLALIGALAGVAVVGNNAHKFSKSSSSSSTALEAKSFPKYVKEFDVTSSDDKVSVYIIAEAFCPNCKEHSYLFDTLIMNQGDDMREILDIKLDMLVLEGWWETGDEGICEKGAYDCMAAQYHLAAQKVYEESNLNEWWDFSRCMYKDQPALIAYYTEEGHKDTTKLHEFVESCATETGLDYSLIKEEYESAGNHLLKMSYGRTIEYDMPVWIYVNGRYIEYEDDWINAICAAYTGDSIPSACVSASSLDGGKVVDKSQGLFKDNGKVDVYIVAEAMCPNCKEHSYYFDNLVMSPEGTKSGIRSAINLYLDQMLIDGWDLKDNLGECEKGKWDCELSRYQLCGQAIDTSDDLSWWDFSRCLYKHQASMIDYYWYDGNTSPALMTSVATECATESGLDYDALASCVDEEGVDLLKESWKRIGGMSDPVWIYVNGQRIDYHEDWLATICAAVAARGYSVDECDFFADV